MAGFKRRTLKELLEVDISKLTQKEIQGYKKVARDEVLRGVKRWEGSKYKSPAWYRLEHETGRTMKISFYRGMTLNEQKNELAKAIHFLSDPTHLKKGWDDFKKRNIQALNKEIGQQRDERGRFKQKFTEEDFDRLYKAFDKAKQINPNVVLDKYKVMESVLDRVKDSFISIDALALMMAENYEEIYKEAEREKQESEKTRSKKIK